MTIDHIRVKADPALLSLSMLNPPSRTRLEPQTRTGDPSPGLAARVHDPLWFLLRQWQFGEFEGEDAGTPLTVRVVTRSTPVDRWAVGTADAAARPLRPADLLEHLVEAESAPVGPAGPGLRPRAEAGSAFCAALGDAGLADPAGCRAAVVAHCPLDLDPASHPDGPHAALDRDYVRLAALLPAGTSADGEQIAAALEEASAEGDALPAWLVAAIGADEVAPVGVLAAQWLHWYREEVAPPPIAAASAWAGDRLEYRFRLGAGGQVLTAPDHGGGDLGWHSFDAGGTLPAPAPAPVPEPAVHALLATPLRYPGMPADRLWEMEDAQVHIGMADAQPWDLARILLAEYALAYGVDWLVVPLDLPIGSFTTVESVVFTTTFEERFPVQPAGRATPGDRWRMFTTTTPDGSGVDGLLVLPGTVSVADGPPTEEVAFLRDEMANMVWAVERSVQGPSGAGRPRDLEHDAVVPPGPGPVRTAGLDYRLATAVPARWIPYVPRAAGPRSIDLVQAAMPDDAGDPVRPLGVLLSEPATAVLHDAEVPREGVTVSRRPALARRADGSYARWTTRRVRVGRGPGSSGLAFDQAHRREPGPGP